MNLPSTDNGVAIVGYSHRMPGGIQSDADFWTLLTEREIVQEPITDRYGKRSPAHRPILGAGAACEPLRGPDSRRRRTAFRPRVLRHVPQRIEADRTAGKDAAQLRVGSHRTRRLEPPLAAQQPHRGFHRCAGSGRVQLAAAARRHRIFRVRHQPRHAGQSGFLPLQPHGVVGHVLHGLFRRTERPARGDERARLRRLRPGAGGCRHLSRQRQDEQQLQPHGSDQSGGQVPFLRCRGQRLHALRGTRSFSLSSRWRRPSGTGIRFTQ